MSFSHLFHEKREVGKTIKSSKVYFSWELLINGKHHKIELYNSKVSGKKKLSLDAQLLTEHKSYLSDFNYSFKIEKHYFNLIQTDNENFDLRIDNKSFGLILKETRYVNQKETQIKETKGSIENQKRGSEFQEKMERNSVSSGINFPSNLKTTSKNMFDDSQFEFESQKKDEKEKFDKVKSSENGIFDIFGDSSNVNVNVNVENKPKGEDFLDDLWGVGNNTQVNNNNKNMNITGDDIFGLSLSSPQGNQYSNDYKNSYSTSNPSIPFNYNQNQQFVYNNTNLNNINNMNNMNSYSNMNNMSNQFQPSTSNQPITLVKGNFSNTQNNFNQVDGNKGTNNKLVDLDNLFGNNISNTSKIYY